MQEIVETGVGQVNKKCARTNQTFHASLTTSKYQYLSALIQKGIHRLTSDSGAGATDHQPAWHGAGAGREPDQLSGEKSLSFCQIQGSLVDGAAGDRSTNSLVGNSEECANILH